MYFFPAKALKIASTVMEECPKFLGSLTLLVLGAGSIKLNEPIYHYTGEQFCRFSASVVIFGHLHWFYGSLGMALFRWMILKHSTKTWFKERTVGVLIGIISLAMTATYTFSTVNIPKTSHDAAYFCCVLEKTHIGADGHF